MLDRVSNADENTAIVSAHARRVVQEVLNRLVVKHTPLALDGQETSQLALLGSELPRALSEAIDNENPLIGLLAAWMLLKLAETPGPYHPKRKSASTRANAALLDAIKQQKPALTLYALVLLSNGCVPPEAAPILTQFLAHSDSAVAVYAAGALTWCGEFGALAVPVLTRALHAEDDLLGTVAANALGRLGLRNEEALSVLVRRLSEAESPFQYSILLALKGLGEKAAAAVPKLFSIARNTETKNMIRAAAAVALAHVQPEHPETRPLLLKFLSESGGHLIEAALRGLEQSGGLPPEIFPRLFELLQSTVDDHRRLAALGFRWFSRTAELALPELIVAICREQNRDVLVELATTSAFLGPAAAKPLCDVIRKGDFHHVGGACVALQLMGKIAAQEIAETLLPETDEVVRRMAVSLLRSLGRDAEPAVTKLATMLPSLDDERVLDALEVISNCETGAMTVVPDLIACMAERQVAVAKSAAAILSRMGPSITPMIEERMAEASAEHREKTQAFLEHFRPKEEIPLGRLLALNVDQELLLFLFAGEIIEKAGSIGLRKVASQLEKIQTVDDLSLPVSEASVRMMLAELNRKLPSPVSRQTTKGTSLTDDGRTLLHELTEYLRWRGFNV